MVIAMGLITPRVYSDFRNESSVSGGVHWWTAAYPVSADWEPGCLRLYLVPLWVSPLLHFTAGIAVAPPSELVWELEELICLQYFEKYLASVTLGYYLLSRWWFPFPFRYFLGACFSISPCGWRAGYLYFFKNCIEKQISILSNVNVKNHWSL